MHFVKFPNFQVVCVIHKINLCWKFGCFGKAERRKKNRELDGRMAKMATTHFLVSVATVLPGRRVATGFSLARQGVGAM